ncbi:MAG: hypothetical protein JW751_18455 [Polyangiaceae bacterium]|nr:hypothetical protein [Polyangiaceae bacterium]
MVEPAGLDMQNESSTPRGLTPYAFGVPLVAGLLGDTDLRRVPLHPLSAPATRVMLTDLCGVCGYADSSFVDAPLVRASGILPIVSGEVDVALLFEDCALAVEVKLRHHPLPPADFHGRYLGAAPDVALLESDRPFPPEEDGAVLLVEGRPVLPGWLLVIGHATWLGWQGVTDLAGALGVTRLTGVLVFEEVIEAIGAREAREVTLTLARRSLKAWFSRHTSLR